MDVISAKEDARSTRYSKSERVCVKPFLKWAGGKGQLLKEIERYSGFTAWVDVCKAWE